MVFLIIDYKNGFKLPKKDYQYIYKSIKNKKQKELNDLFDNMYKDAREKYIKDKITVLKKQKNIESIMEKIVGDYVLAILINMHLDPRRNKTSLSMSKKDKGIVDNYVYSNLRKIKKEKNLELFLKTVSKTIEKKENKKFLDRLIRLSKHYGSLNYLMGELIENKEVLYSIEKYIDNNVFVF